LQVGERLCHGVAVEPFQANADARLHVTASVGIATLERSDDSAEAVLRRADAALYAAKREGRNRVVVDAA
jgi:two-component system cell cycle response regulator